MYKECIGWDGKPITQCYITTDLIGNFAKVLVKPFDTFYGEVNGNVIALFFNSGNGGMFYSLADYFVEVEEEKK